MYSELKISHTEGSFIFELLAYSLFLCISVHSIGDNDSFEDKGVEAVMETMKKIPNLQHFKLG